MDRLVFVYNADGGLLNALGDWTHKLVSPQTYPCSLCALTYSHWGMRREWKRFVRALDAEVVFLHRDELGARYGEPNAELPAVFREDDGALQPLIEAPELDACGSLDALVRLVQARVAATSRPPRSAAGPARRTRRRHRP